MTLLISLTVYLEDHILFPAIAHTELERKTKRSGHAHWEVFLVKPPSFQRVGAQGLLSAVLAIHGENTFR